MDLPVNPPVEPMLAKSTARIPAAEGMYYEPKWDGFRCIVFRDGAQVVLGSRGGKQLERYFPEVVSAAIAELPDRCVIDGELVVAGEDKLEFDLLSQRIHPAAKRIRLLAEQTPALFIAFDMLAHGNESFMDAPFSDRRARLEEVISGVPEENALMHRTVITQDFDRATEWFSLFEGAGLDGLVAKPADMPYEPGKRLMAKIKHERTADVVISGFRWHRASPAGAAIGSLLLGLYDESGRLHHVGVSASFSAARRRELIDELREYRNPASHPWLSGEDLNGAEVDQRRPGATNRWTGNKDQSWEPLRPALVAEVRYDHMEGDRFRHTAQFVRWRPDREPDSCTYAQLERPVRYNLATVLRGSS